MQENLLLQNTSASKEILPEIFSQEKIDIGKKEYYLLAEAMNPEEIPAEVTEKLDEIANYFGELEG